MTDTEKNAATYDSVVEPPSQGQGVGAALVINERVAASELRLFRRAIRNRWPIEARLRADVIRICEGLMNSDDPRVVASALKTLVEANRQNVIIDTAEDAHEYVKSGGVTERVEERRTIKVTFDQGG